MELRLWGCKGALEPAIKPQGRNTGIWKSTEGLLPQAGPGVRVGLGEEEGVSGRASWRRYWLSGTLKGKDQGQVHRQRSNMGKSQEAREASRAVPRGC